ncbi:HAMP domain-containing histidine kinase [Bacteroides fragilis]|nr:HAMP domain-containing histidine kinase [Bacteroides fragilis]
MYSLPIPVAVFQAINIKKVFERFYKINSFVQGAGLGLSVCKTIVEGLGGTINVYSQLKEGSRFSVILPLNRLHK